MGLYEESAQISLLLSRPQMPKEKPLAEISAHIFFSLLLFTEFPPGCLSGPVYLI